ncbi:hypothetical protein SDC9_63549 [bioreactor metagenome]|uniref:Uncharacterized protein n=1 Tax=bioreactor metagenome TaxID=1076179 RepID=A0A644XMX5_9ZZZZ
MCADKPHAVAAYERAEHAFLNALADVVDVVHGVVVLVHKIDMAFVEPPDFRSCGQGIGDRFLAVVNGVAAVHNGAIAVRFLERLQELVAVQNDQRRPAFRQNGEQNRQEFLRRAVVCGEQKQVVVLKQHTVQSSVMQARGRHGHDFQHVDVLEPVAH